MPGTGRSHLGLFPALLLLFLIVGIDVVTAIPKVRTLTRRDKSEIQLGVTDMPKKKFSERDKFLTELHSNLKSWGSNNGMLLEIYGEQHLSSLDACLVETSSDNGGSWKPVAGVIIKQNEYQHCSFRVYDLQVDSELGDDFVLRSAYEEMLRFIDEVIVRAGADSMEISGSYKHGYEALLRKYGYAGDWTFVKTAPAKVAEILREDWSTAGIAQLIKSRDNQRTPTTSNIAQIISGASENDALIAAKITLSWTWAERDEGGDSPTEARLAAIVVAHRRVTQQPEQAAINPSSPQHYDAAVKFANISDAAKISVFKEALEYLERVLSGRAETVSIALDKPGDVYEDAKQKKEQDTEKWMSEVLQERGYVVNKARDSVTQTSYMKTWYSCCIEGVQGTSSVEFAKLESVDEQFLMLIDENLAPGQPKERSAAAIEQLNVMIYEVALSFQADTDSERKKRRVGGIIIHAEGEKAGHYRVNYLAIRPSVSDSMQKEIYRAVVGYIDMLRRKVDAKSIVIKSPKEEWMKTILKEYGYVHKVFSGDYKRKYNP